ncbi:isopenicillin-N epimerase [Stackebrandtia albiflava]|uniref:Isopenicillin-N epimerase n=1 Tax=Stackebrandtia albiflava TaxID=406432 RepID=A0A562VAE9_9ACTN|nr:aminotransferase class V-fold PLP-dependent enzyme [Stackebrandtia albiflava]TWJ14856.1 isopenicillin-N epimerase [Stackebrandtia albiflava]
MNLPRPPQPIPGARSLFSLDPRMAHLNHGSLGAVPFPVQHAQRLLMDEAERDPRAFAAQVPTRLRLAREAVCPTIGADADLTAFVTNTTTGVALALHSLDLSSGDEIVTTDHGYPSIDFNVAAYTRSRGVVHRVAPVPLDASDDEVVDAVLAAVTARTRLVILDHITSATARLFPVARVSATLRDRGVPLLVDAAHVPGHIPADVAAVGADFWIGNVHKWAFAPRGTALFSVAPHRRERIRPLVESYGQASGFPESVEFHGTDGYTGWIASPAGPAILSQLGLERVWRHNSELAAYGQAVIAKALNTDPADLGRPSPLAMRLIPLPEGVATTQEAALALWQRIRDRLRTETAVNCWNGRGVLRIAAHVHNGAEQYERLADGLPGLLAE